MEDPAFVWQQLARESHREPRPAQDAATLPHGPASSTRWVTLHEAEELTGVPASTVRNWARKERIPTRFELAPEGQVRMVDLDAVVTRARHLGRLRPPPAARPGPAPPHPPTTSSGPTPEAPEGSVLVPIDAWNRMINQLGNLHEAGQQLAEARERAARAETEAVFLRERLAEMRKLEAEAVVVSQPEPGAAEPQVPEPQPQSALAPPRSEPPEIEPAWLYLYRRWENRSRKRHQKRSR